MVQSYIYMIYDINLIEMMILIIMLMDARVPAVARTPFTNMV